MPALVHRDTWHEVRPQRARYELTCVRAGGGLNSLLRQLRQLLRYQVVVLGELLRRQLMRQQLQHRRLRLREAELLRVTLAERCLLAERRLLAEGCLLVKGCLLAERSL